MATPRFKVTYARITEESAEQGDFAESGFCVPYGWRFPVPPQDPNDPELLLTLRQAYSMCTGLEDSGSWFTEIDGEQDYRSGDVEIKSIHPPKTITPSSYARVRRALGIGRKSRY